MIGVRGCNKSGVFVEEATSELEGAGLALNFPMTVDPGGVVNMMPVWGGAAGENGEKMVFKGHHVRDSFHYPARLSLAQRSIWSVIVPVSPPP